MKSVTALIGLLTIILLATFAGFALFKFLVPAHPSQTVKIAQVLVPTATPAHYTPPAAPPAPSGYKNIGVAGFVYLDKNSNLKFDDQDVKLRNIPVDLYDSASATRIGSIRTAESGYFTFTIPVKSSIMIKPRTDANLYPQKQEYLVKSDTSEISIPYSSTPPGTP